MNQLKNQIQRLIRDETNNIFTSTEGRVMGFDNERMIAKVSVKNQRGKGHHIYDNVPIQIGTSGFSQSGPYIGDKVILNFKNGSGNTPVIVAIVDYNHKSNFRDVREKHSRKGAMCPDNICIRDDWECSGSMYQDIASNSDRLM